jgi:hypothetical protein
MTDDGSHNVNTALLLRVLDQIQHVGNDLAGLKVQMEHGAHKFEVIETEQKKISSIVTPLAQQVGEMMPQVKNMVPQTAKIPALEKDMKGMKAVVGRIGSIYSAAALVVTGMVWAFWTSVTMALDWVKTNLGHHLHWS